MTPNKLPPLPEPSDDDLPVPIAYGMRRKGEISVIGVVPNKVHVKPATSETYLREFEEVALFTAEQLHAAREQAFHDGQCQALRQSQSLPAGAVADLGLLLGQMLGQLSDNRAAFDWKIVSDYYYRLDAIFKSLQSIQADAREKGEIADLESDIDTLVDHNMALQSAIHDAIKIHSSFGTTADMADWLRDELDALTTQPAQASEAAIPEGFCLVPKDALLTEARRLRYRMTETCGLGPAMTDAGAQMKHTAEALEGFATSSQETASE